jgi:Cupin superfamily protein
MFLVSQGRSSKVQQLLEIDATGLRDAFAKRSVAVGHNLVDHPFFTIDAMAELADRLPPDSVRRERGNLPLVNRDGYVDVGEGPPSATIRDIERNGFRVSLRDIQQDPEYARLIDECLDEVEAVLGNREGGMRRRTGYLFITAPAANTPMHFDPEHSFLLQVRGKKHVSVAAFQDDAVRQRELDRYYDGKQCDFAAMEEVAELFTLDPGVGVYLPSFVPHWVTTEAGVSVSFSIPFYTEFSERAESVNRINRRLRRMHLSPRGPGASEPVDRVKATSVELWVKLRETRRKMPA